MCVASVLKGDGRLPCGEGYVALNERPRLTLDDQIGADCRPLYAVGHNVTVLFPLMTSVHICGWTMQRASDGDS